MIQNIVDSRVRKLRWRSVNAIVEPTWHDNSAADSDRAESMAGELDYEQKEGISVADAITWAQQFSFPVTLHLYDEDKGVHPATTSTMAR